MQIESELQQKYALAQRQESIIKGLEEESRQIVIRIEQSLNVKNHEENATLDAFDALGLKLDFQDKDFLLFTVTKEELENVLNQVRLISQKAFSFQNFTQIAPDLSHREYIISIYIDRGEMSVEHWHVSLVMPNQKGQLLDIIREKGGVINYEFEDEVVFSISNMEIEKLRAQMSVMRIGLSEYGYRGREQSELSEDLTVVSVYFLSL